MCPENAMSRRKHERGLPVVRWAVTDQALGGLTVERVIALHHFMAFTSDAALLHKELTAYKPPTTNDPYWTLHAKSGEIWRMAWHGVRSGFVYEIWWKDEWRKRQKPPRWVQALCSAIEYGKRKQWDAAGEEVVAPPVEAAPDEEQQLTLC